MSGGSFDYLCYAADTGHLGERRGGIADMAKALEEYEQPAASKAAAETRNVLALLEQADEAAQRLHDIWHAVEWHHSSDWSEGDVLGILQQYWEASQ